MTVERQGSKDTLRLLASERSKRYIMKSVEKKLLRDVFGIKETGLYQMCEDLM